MTTKRCRITDKAIERHLLNDTITRLSDERYRLELRFHRNRQSGSWWFIDKRKHNGRDGRARWERLGTWPQLPAKALIEQMPQKLAKLATDQQVVVSEWETIGEVLQWYLDHVMSSRQITKVRQSTVKSVITKHLAPALNESPLAGVRKHHIKQQLIWPLQQVYSLRTVKSYFSVLKAAFAQAAREELLPINPIMAMQFRDFIQARPEKKEGRLHPPMVEPLLQSLSMQPIAMQVLVMLQLGHGTRITETRLARWCHFDWQERVWRLPASHTKTREPLFLPLTDQMVALLTLHKAKQPEGTLVVFPGSDHKTAIGKDKANDWYQHISQGEWSSHDCRKLARSRLADLGVDTFVGERLLNHKLSDLNQAYIHTTTERLKRDALETYHSWLDMQGFFILHGKTVGRSTTQNQVIEAAGWL